MPNFWSHCSSALSVTAATLGLQLTQAKFWKLLYATSVNLCLLMKIAKGMAKLFVQMKERVFDLDQILYLWVIPPSPVTQEISTAGCHRPFLHLLAALCPNYSDVIPASLQQCTRHTPLSSPEVCSPMERCSKAEVNQGHYKCSLLEINLICF